jgi:hypothetical protein
MFRKKTRFKSDPILRTQTLKGYLEENEEALSFPSNQDPARKTGVAPIH